MKKTYIKNADKPIQKYRSIIQLIFVLLCIWIGVEFYLFIGFLESGGTTGYFERPPGAEAFLPISAMMSIYYFTQTGIIHDAHPAGFFILTAVILVSFFFGKSFCSWICPIGTLSEYIGDFGERVQKKLFRKVYRLPRWLDYPLRSLKYLLLAFFVYSIFFTMTVTSLRYFLDSPYNVMSDIKMWMFFSDLSRTSLIVLSVLFVLSIVARNFWCRYLCPYGALLGIFSLLSPNKIKRNLKTCIDCGLCAKACPSRIKVDELKTVFSDECSTCMSCVDACPVADTLDLKSLVTKEALPKKMIVFGIIAVFILVTGAGILTGNWQNKIAKSEYLKNYESVGSLGHPRSINELEELNKNTQSGQSQKSTNDREK